MPIQPLIALTVGALRCRSRLTARRVVLVLIPVVILIVNFQSYVNGWLSLLSSIQFAITDWPLFYGSFNAGRIEFWVASLSLTAWIGAAAFVGLRKLHNEEPSPDVSYLRRRWREELSTNAASRWSLWFLAFLYATLFLCPFLAPLDPDHHQDIVVTRYRSPLSRVTYLKLQPEARSPLANSSTRLHRTPPRVYVDSYQILSGAVVYQMGRDTAMMTLDRLAGTDERTFAGTQLFVLGTDKFGRDILSRIIYGTRISLLVATIAVVVAAALGIFVGAVAGYVGGWTETILMRLTDLVLAFPILFLILLVVGLVGPSLIVLMTILGLTGWMGVARLVRGQILSLKEQTFIMKARAFGLPRRRIILAHLIPNVLTPVIVAVTLRIGATILVEAALSFLGLGVQPPTASWGNMIAEGRDSLLYAWWVSTFPGVFLTLTVLGFSFLGEALRDVTDPTTVKGVVGLDTA